MSAPLWFSDDELTAMAAEPSTVDSVAVARLIDEAQRLRRGSKTMNRLFHDNIVVMQSAVIAAETESYAAGIQWIWNCLEGPGSLPDETEPWSDDAQMWYNANRSEPYGPCGVCGRPSSSKGSAGAACSNRHYMALQGTLPDEECSWCRVVKVCAHEVDTRPPRDNVQSVPELIVSMMRQPRGKPVCADCWPKIERQIITSKVIA